MAENYLRLSNTTIVVSLKCNLKCRLCAVSAPYYKNPDVYELSVLEESVRAYFKAVDFVDKFTVNGGEPLIYPQIAEFMDFLNQFSNKMGLLEIITNGSVAASDALLDALKKNPKVDILIDDYGKELSGKADCLIDSFQSAGIKYRRRKYYGQDAHLGGWVDLSHLGKKERTQEETANIYANCAYPGAFHCFVLFGGKAYICGVYKKCVSEGMIPDIKEEYVDFLAADYDPNVEKERIRDFHNRKYFSACNYCDGFGSESKRYVPAEQL